jgi:phosphatidylserine/phosphatidylglycerophosphate/cardiolipin synthase-like enzyme
MMRLLVQPGDGVAPLVKAIHDAKKTIEILIFRFDRVEIETALVKAVSRGVAVRALIAYTNRGGERSLRALELRLLAAGVTVARTDDDLIRYHGKMMIVDGSELYLMAFNLTHLDIERSRSFAVITDDADTVAEATKLFEADSRRLPYTAGMDTFVVSPLNARKQISDFIKAAKEELLIYDPALADPAMGRLLEERSRAGVRIRVLGRLSRKVPGAEAHKLFMRLHTRLIVRDRQGVFIGSQSLRTAELDERREVGLIFQEPKITSRLIETFEDDWARSSEVAEKDECADAAGERPPVRKVARKVAKSVVKIMPPVAPVLEVVVRELAGPKTQVDVNAEELEATVRQAVKSAIQEVVATAVEEASRDLG